MRKWRSPTCGHKNVGEIGKEDKDKVSLPFHSMKERHAIYACLRGGWVPQSREDRRSMHGTDLFRFFVLSVLHRVVDMAEHILNGIWVCQVEGKECHKWMVLNLSVTSCEDTSDSYFIC